MQDDGHLKYGSSIAISKSVRDGGAHDEQETVILPFLISKSHIKGVE